MNINIIRTLRNSAYLLLQDLIEEEEDFKIILWQSDTWSKKLPESILLEFPSKILLRFDKSNKDNNYRDEDGIVFLTYIFEDKEYIKEVFLDDIFAITSLDSQPYILCDFPRDLEIGKTKNEVLDMIVKEGITEEEALSSYNVFNN